MTRNHLRARDRGERRIIVEELDQLLARIVIISDGVFAATDGFFVVDEISERLGQSEFIGNHVICPLGCTARNPVIAFSVWG